mgnify:CR=1 FL=1
MGVSQENLSKTGETVFKWCAGTDGEKPITILGSGGTKDSGGDKKTQIDFSPKFFCPSVLSFQSNVSLPDED